MTKTPVTRKRVEKVDGFAVILKGDERLYSATDGLGVFDNKVWAQHLAKRIGLQYVEVVPCVVSFHLPKPLSASKKKGK